MVPFFFGSSLFHIVDNLPRLQNDVHHTKIKEHILIFPSSEHNISDYEALVDLIQDKKNPLWILSNVEYYEQTSELWKHSTVILHSFSGHQILKWSLEHQIYPKRLVLIGVPLEPYCNPKLLSSADVISSSNPKEIWDWCESGTSLDLHSYPVPLWFTSSPLDYVSPPEMNFDLVPPYSHHRVGPQFFQYTIPEHEELIYHPSTLFYISRFVQRKRLKHIRKKSFHY